MFSGGKDSFAALDALNASAAHEPAALVSTYNEDAGRIALHGTPAALLRRQATSLDLPLTEIGLPEGCDNETYIERVASGLSPLTEAGISVLAFGDLFLEDIREFRERQFADSDFRLEFPLWQQDSTALAHRQIERGIEAVICCVDLQVLPESMLGRTWDEAFLASLPDGVDPCGENGEFHTFVVDAPEMHRRVEVRAGEKHVSHDRFCMLDLRPA